jgi:hypothetical protein
MWHRSKTASSLDESTRAPLYKTFATFRVPLCLGVQTSTVACICEREIGAVMHVGTKRNQGTKTF